MNNTSKTNAVFLSGSLMGHVTRMSLTASVGLMAIFAVDFVDMVFISMLGQDALAAAVGYAATLLFFTDAICIGLSIAAGSLVSQSIGAGDREEAKSHATTVALLGILFGVFFSVLVFVFADRLLAYLGASGEILDLSARYVRIVIPSMWAMAVALVGMAVLRAYGDARRSMLATLYGSGLNALLVPILIFGFGLGLDGAAIASVLAKLCMMVFSVYPAHTSHRAFQRPRLAETTRSIHAAFGIAIPAILTNLATPVGNAIIVREITPYGTDAIAGMAIIGRLTPVALSVIFALSAALGPIVGQNFGAGRMDRVKKTYYSGLLFALIYVALVGIILIVLRPMISQLFNATGITRDLIYLFCGPLAFAAFFNAMIFVGNACFNNLGFSLYSTWVNWGRHTVGTWPLAVGFGFYWGPQGVLIGQAFGGLLFAALSFGLFLRVFTKLEHQ